MVLNRHRFFLLFLWLSAAFIYPLEGVNAQDFSVPTGWTGRTSSLSPDQRAQLAHDAIGLLTPRIDSTKGLIPDISSPSEAATFLSVLALNDWISGNKAYQETVKSNIQTFEGLNPKFVTEPVRLPLVLLLLRRLTYRVHVQDALNSDTVAWGLAAYYAYRAYNDQALLQSASLAWTQMSQYMVTETQAANGSHPLRNVTFQSTCSGSTVAGGVFWKADALSDTGVSGQTIGPFLALSAYLFEATSDSRYNASAELSAAFIRNHLYNGIIIRDVFNVQGCGSNTVVATYNPGFAIEGFSVWGNVSNNTEWSSLSSSLVATTVPFPTWTGPDGVIIEAARDDQKNLLPNDIRNGFKGFFMRGLHEAWWRSDPNSDMAKLIESFITVQFNALIHLASTSAPANVYSPSWSGPAISAFAAYPEVTALQVLNPALGLSLSVNSNSRAGDGTTTVAPSATPSAASSARSSSRHTGAIVGGVVGALFGLLAILALALFAIRRHRRQMPLLSGEESGSRPGPATIEPFISEPFTRPPNIMPVSFVLPNGAVTTKFRRESALPRQPESSKATTSKARPAGSSVSYPSAGPSASQPSSHGFTSPASAGSFGGDSGRNREHVNASEIPALVREVVDGILFDTRAQTSQKEPEDAPPPIYEQ